MIKAWHHLAFRKSALTREQSVWIGGGARFGFGFGLGLQGEASCAITHLTGEQSVWVDGTSPWSFSTPGNATGRVMATRGVAETESLLVLPTAFGGRGGD